MDTQINSTQNNKDWLLTEAEARAALLKMEEKDREEIRMKKKLVEEAEEAIRKWPLENDGRPRDLLVADLYKAQDYGFWEDMEIFKQYEDVNFEEFFKEFVEIEYETEHESELPGISDEEKQYIWKWKWECDLIEGWFRTSLPGDITRTYFGRFIKDEDGEWTALIVRICVEYLRPHGYPRGGREGTTQNKND